MTDTGNVRNFPGVADPALAADRQPDQAVTEHGADCCHELMAAITYLQLRYGNKVNANFEREPAPPGGGVE